MNQNIMPITLYKVLCVHTIGAEVNKTCRMDTMGCTPLHLAAISGDVEIAKMLLAYGAQPEATDQHRATPLHKAAEYQSTEVAILLLAQK